MPLVNTEDTRRSYRSPLREQQAAATRERILDGLAKTMAEGLAEVSMPAVARAAGVSVATVYRHFPTKKDLFDAAPDHFARRTGMDVLPVPTTYVELEHSTQAIFENIDELSDVMRAAMDSALGDVARRAQMPARLRSIERIVESLAPTLEEPATSRVVRLLLVLTSSGAHRMLTAAGLSAEEAAREITWAVRRIIEAETGTT